VNDDTERIPYVDVLTSTRSPAKPRKRREERGLDAQLQPVVILAALGSLCIIGLIMLAFAPGHSVTIETTLANGVVASVAAIAGLVRPGVGGES
jgi:hypothetical protein